MFSLYFFTINGLLFDDLFEAIKTATKIAKEMGYTKAPYLIELGGGDYEVIYENAEGYTIKAEIEFI